MSQWAGEGTRDERFVYWGLAGRAEVAVMIDPHLDYRRLRLDAALYRLDHQVWLPFCENPLTLIRLWVHPGGKHTFDLLIIGSNPDDVAVCRATLSGGHMHLIRLDRGTVERMVQAATNLGTPARH